MDLGSRILATALLGIATLAPALLARALTFEVVERECPIDGTKFESAVMRSGTVFCVRLDLKRLGAIADPPPLHECPHDGFVWYDDGFTDSEIDSLRQWVQSPEYAALVSSESPHLRLARIYERLGRDPFQISTAYRRAAWMVEARDSEKYRRDLGASLSHLLRAKEQPDPSVDARERAVREILAGELERQLGDFEAARTRFTALRDAGGFADPIHADIVRYELELIAARDRDPHPVPSEGADEGACDD